MRNSLYPIDWQTIAREIKESVGYKCLACGRQCRRPGQFYLGWEYELTCAHICQDYSAPVVYVAALCLPCHLKHDAPYSWVARLRRKRLRQQAAGQLEIYSYR